MNNKHKIMNEMEEISEEITDSNNINPNMGPKSPVIKAKLDATNPSLLNLSEMSMSMSNRTNSNIFDNSNSNIGNMNNAKDYHPPTKLSLFSRNVSFVPGHIKANSNEVFSNIKILNNTESKQKKDNDSDEDLGNGDISPIKRKEINFVGGNLNFWGGENNEEKHVDDEKVYIEDKIKQEDNEGLNILDMLKKMKNQK